MVLHHEDVEQEIEQLLKQQTTLQAKDIFTKLKKKAARATIAKALKNLKETNKIIKIKRDKFQEYGINNTAKNAIYYAHAEILEKTKVFTTHLKYLQEGTEKEQQRALQQLSWSKDTTLLPEHLDKLIPILKNTKHANDGWNLAVYILIQNATKGIIPNKLDELKNTIKKCYEYLKSVDQKEIKWKDQIIKAIILLLGTLQDDTAINIILELADEPQALYNSNEFEDWRMRPVILKNEQKIVEKEYQIDDNKSRILLGIRNKAKENEQTYNLNSKPLQQALKNHKKQTK